MTGDKDNYSFQNSIKRGRLGSHGPPPWVSPCFYNTCVLDDLIILHPWLENKVHQIKYLFLKFFYLCFKKFRFFLLSFQFKFLHSLFDVFQLLFKTGNQKVFDIQLMKKQVYNWSEETFTPSVKMNNLS